MKLKIAQCKRHSHALPSIEYAPERLLDVREDHPKLISGSGPWLEAGEHTPRYAALSYCWGTEKEATHQLTTTLQTMPERQRGIKYNKMPPVLRDAVYVAKSLDIPFLWVDALCIIQGDTLDWEKQCAQMDKIYGHSEVTLVAASSNSCRERFLHPEATSTMLPCFPRVSKRLPLIGGLMQVRFSGITEAGSFGGHYSEMNDSRLATRGWAVQERILSTRMIIFGRSNVQFVCPSSRQEYRDHNYLISRVRESDNGCSHFYWTKVLDEYRSITVESFTQPTDLLPALSGLAAYFGSRIKDRYCAGHWHKDLYRSLMWCNARPSGDPQTLHVSRACSPSPYIVPSWSRLGKGNSYALDQHLSDPKQGTLKLDAHITQTGENPFGAIRDAQLEVCTHTICLRNAKNIYLDTEWLLVPRAHCPESWKISLVERDKPTFSGKLRWTRRRLDCCIWVDYDLKAEDLRRDAKGWKWVLLGFSLGQPFGLLLSHANDSKWCRVGIFAPPIYTRPHAGPRPTQLKQFTDFSNVETVTII